MPPGPGLLLREVRLVPVRRPVPDGPVDVRVAGGRVVEVAPRVRPHDGDRVVDAAGRWALPGLWDAHVHLRQWSRTRGQLDVGAATGPEQVTRLVAEHVARLGPPSGTLVVGHGYRSATWARRPTVAELDAVAGGHAVVLVSGDVHNGWVSSAAQRLLGVEPTDAPLQEAAWFALLPRLEAALPAGDPVAQLRAAAQDAAAHGVVGVGDMEMEAGPVLWPDRVAAGVDLLRVRTATYPDGLDAVLAAGLRTGDPLPGGGGLAVMGPVKTIFDGSLNTATAYCCAPYAPAGGAPTRGVLNLSPQELVALCARAHAHGLELAVHAIGDAAVTHALDALAAAGARGAVEHVQLVADADLPRFAVLGVRASVQPAHLLDDRDVTDALWPDRAGRSFPLRALHDAGAELALGSDAPVAPLDPWLAMAAAVHRSGDGRAPWHQEQALTAAEALAASTDGQPTVGPGSRGDVVLLDHDPLAPQPDAAATAAHLRSVRVAATVLGGRLTHEAL